MHSTPWKAGTDVRVWVSDDMFGTKTKSPTGFMRLSTLHAACWQTFLPTYKYHVVHILYASHVSLACIRSLLEVAHCVQLVRRIGVHVVQDGHEDAGVPQQRRRMPDGQAMQRGQRGADLWRS